MNEIDECLSEYIQEKEMSIINAVKQGKKDNKVNIGELFPEFCCSFIRTEQDTIGGTEEISHNNNNKKVTYGEKSKVRINNPEDAVEVAIKNNIEINIPYKSWNEIFLVIGKEVLQNAGILDLNQSFYKKKAQKLLSHYGEFPLTGGTKYERCCTVLYEEPKFDIEILKEGNRFYRDRGVPLLLQFIKKEFETMGKRIYTTPETLAEAVGLINSRFGMDRNQLMDMNPKLTDGIIHQFYLYTKPELNKVIYSLLDDVQNNYKIIQYRNLHWVEKETGERFYTDDEQEKIIKDAECYVLQRDFNTERITTVFYRKKVDEFYAAVIRHINQAHNLDWVSFKKRIQIDCINEERFYMLQTAMQSDKEVCRKLALEINQRFFDRIRRKIFSEYDRTNRKADEEMVEFFETLDDNPDYQEYLSVCVPHDIALIYAAPNQFRIHPNCYEYQEILMDTVLKIGREWKSR